jgi:O-antigen/teichoic acid export membrane protein
MRVFSQDKDLIFRINQFKDLTKTTTAKHSSIVFGGNLISTGLAVIATLFLARTLGPVNYGTLSIYTSIYTTILGLTDFGLGLTAVKLISSNLKNNPHKSHSYMKIIFYMEVLSGLIVALVGIIFSGLIAKGLGGEYLLFPVRMAFLAGAFASTGAFVGPFLTSHGKFFKNSALGVSTSIVKTAGVVILFLLTSLTLNNVILFYVILNIGMFLVGVAISPKGFTEKTTKNENKKAIKDIFHFSKWVLLSYFATVIASRLDIFLISRYKGQEQVGIYSAALQLSLLLPLLIGSMTTVLLPLVSKYKKKAEYLSYIKKYFIVATAIIILCIPALIISPYLIKIIFGSKYDSSILIFQILFIAYLPSVLANPISLIVFSMNKPKSITIINYLQLVLAVILNVLLIPRYGIFGAAISFLVTNISSAIAVLSYTLYSVKKIKD